MESFLKTGKLDASDSPSGSKKAREDGGSTSKPSRPARPVPWVEKYRPKSVDDVAYQDEVVAVLKKCLTAGADLPNLLFYGPPGTGKTSTILAAARDLFGPELFRQRILELNASDERGINVVRQKVKTFAQQTAVGSGGAGAKRPDGKPCPPFKIIILDEADSMTRDAQSALRRTMEKEGRSTKFCLICNYVSRIIEPLTSRCAKFRFKPLARDVLVGRLRLIADKERLRVEDAAMEALLETSAGDLRKAITSLQSCARLKAASASEEGDGDAVTEADVSEISGVVPEHWMDKLLKTCRGNSFELVQSFVDELSAEGFAVVQVIEQLHQRVVQDKEEAFSDRQKSLICERMAVCESRLLDGANEYLQLLDLASLVTKTIAEGA